MAMIAMIQLKICPELEEMGRPFQLVHLTPQSTIAMTVRMINKQTIMLKLTF